MLDRSIQVSRGARTYCEKDWRWNSPPGKDTGYNLWLIAGGEGRLQTSSATYDLHPGDCFMLRMRDLNIATHNPLNPLVVPWVCFDFVDDDGHKLADDHNPFFREHRHIPDLSFFDAIVQRIIDLIPEGVAKASRAQHWLRTALLELEDYDRRPLLAGLDLKQGRLVDELCSRIRKQPEAFPGVQAMADEAHCSLDHFIRIFKKHKGTTPWDFLVRCRIEKACGMLQFSAYTVSEIADALGYLDIYSFSRQFKAKTGQSPTAYRGHR